MSKVELQKRIAELEAENALLRHDISIIGPENVRLSNVLALAQTEIARLTAPKSNGRRGAPKKDVTGSYEDYLVRLTMQIVVESMWGGGKKMNERDAAIKADERIRAAANNAQNSGMPGPFFGLAASYPADKNSIYTAFRRGKRALGFARKRQTKK